MLVDRGVITPPNDKTKTLCIGARYGVFASDHAQRTSILEYESVD